MLTEPFVEPTTKNQPLGENVNEDTSKRELNSVETSPVPISYMMIRVLDPSPIAQSPFIVHFFLM